MEKVLIVMESVELQKLMREAVLDALQEASLGRNDPAADTDGEDSDILDVDGACKLLKIKKKTLYQKTHRREIPFMKKGKPLKFSREELLKWLASGRKKTVQEEFDEADRELERKNKWRWDKK